jgi:hypothetical protein
MPPSEVFSDQIENRDEAEKLKKLKLKEKYAKIKSGLYEPDTDDESEWDVNDLSKNFIFSNVFLQNVFCFVISKPGGLDVETNRDRDRERP